MTLRSWLRVLKRRRSWKALFSFLLGFFMLGTLGIQHHGGHGGRLFEEFFGGSKYVDAHSILAVAPKVKNVTVNAVLTTVNTTTQIAATPSHITSNTTERTEAIQKRRHEVIRSVCERHSWPPLNTKAQRWSRVDSKFQTIYCGIPKCGTTSWTTLALDLHGEVGAPLEDHFKLMTKHGIKFMNKMSVAEAKSKIPKYYKYVFVRHPLEKLLSAWKDKLAQKKDREYFHNTIGKQIIRKYRKNPSPEALRMGNDATFPEFVKYVIDVVSKSSNVDQHIERMYKQCHPCTMRYDFIGKMETLADDAEYVLRRAYHQTEIHNLPSKNQASLKSSENTTAFYYSQVPPEDIARLKEIYRLDMELFDYSMDIPGYDS